MNSSFLASKCCRSGPFVPADERILDHDLDGDGQVQKVQATLRAIPNQTFFFRTRIIGDN